MCPADKDTAYHTMTRMILCGHAEIETGLHNLHPDIKGQ